MATLQNLQRFLTERRPVQLADGRVARLVRIDTLYPAAATTVTVWTDLTEPGVPDSTRPGVAKVPLSEIVGEAATGTA